MENVFRRPRAFNLLQGGSARGRTQLHKQMCPCGHNCVMQQRPGGHNYIMQQRPGGHYCICNNVLRIVLHSRVHRGHSCMRHRSLQSTFNIERGDGGAGRKCLLSVGSGYERFYITLEMGGPSILAGIVDSKKKLICVLLATIDLHIFWGIKIDSKHHYFNHKVIVDDSIGKKALSVFNLWI